MTEKREDPNWREKQGQTQTEIDFRRIPITPDEVPPFPFEWDYQRAYCKKAVAIYKSSMQKQKRGHDLPSGSSGWSNGVQSDFAAPISPFVRAFTSFSTS